MKPCHKNQSKEDKKHHFNYITPMKMQTTETGKTGDCSVKAGNESNDTEDYLCHETIQSDNG